MQMNILRLHHDSLPRYTENKFNVFINQPEGGHRIVYVNVPEFTRKLPARLLRFRPTVACFMAAFPQSCDNDSTMVCRCGCMAWCSQEHRDKTMHAHAVSCLHLFRLVRCYEWVEHENGLQEMGALKEEYTHNHRHSNAVAVPDEDDLPDDYLYGV
jgi:hypothetical protein